MGTSNHAVMSKFIDPGAVQAQADFDFLLAGSRLALRGEAALA